MTKFWRLKIYITTLWKWLEANLWQRITNGWKRLQYVYYCKKFEIFPYEPINYLGLLRNFRSIAAVVGMLLLIGTTYDNVWIQPKLKIQNVIRNAHTNASFSISSENNKGNKLLIHVFYL